ncbi:MAG: hypothetical protein DRP09_18865 [Candidatus Thorarchaeota archaeon]|nr:MAG: hypothetical protein DRP09_18865 [Candidatus Thorarchaeota archaeon]
MFSIIDNDKIDFFRVYLDRYGMKQFIVLVILAIMASLLVFVTAKKAYKAIKEYNKLQKEGILTTAYVSDIAFGGGRMGSNFVYYQFYDLNNRLVEKKEQVGRKVQGKLLKNIKKGDKIQIRYLKDEPSICQIVGNTGPMMTRIGFLVFFTIMWLIIFAIMFSQIVKTVEVVSLYKHGIATKGIMLSKKINTTGVDISYQFTDDRGKIHVSKEKIRRVELANDLVEGATVTVFYKKDNPAKSTIFVHRCGK